jgi:biotin-dependent carboxylase-like uncharacterized protein
MSKEPGSVTALRVLAGGLLATVEDLGRPAARRYGVPGGGAMDAFAIEAANRLAGNPPGAAALEIAGGGAVFEALAPLLLALAGADLGARLGGRPLAPWTAALVRPGAHIQFQGRPGDWGARAYLALAGGIATPQVLGSRGTCLAGGFGGFAGRPLRPGDVLEAGASREDVAALAGRRWPAERRPAYRAEPVLRVTRGPHAGRFAADSLAALVGEPFRVSPTSNRMGYRLEGPLLHTQAAVDLPSLGVLPGAIQVPPDGGAILLMADAQTTGGYPIAGVVIGADLPLAAQLLPGDRLRFAVVEMEEAVDARRVLRAWLDAGPEEDETRALLGWAGALGADGWRRSTRET